MSVRLAALVLSVFAWVQTPAPAKHYASSRECGFSFDYPGDWVPTPVEGKVPCRVRLRPTDFAARVKEDDVDVFTLEVGRDSSDFLQAAGQGFDFIDGKWVTLGRANTEATVVLTEHWSGLRGTAASGCSRQSDGAYAGLCDRDVLVLRDRDTDDVWSMVSAPQAGAVFRSILATFKFTKG